VVDGFMEALVCKIRQSHFKERSVTHSTFELISSVSILHASDFREKSQPKNQIHEPGLLVAFLKGMSF